MSELPELQAMLEGARTAVEATAVRTGPLTEAEARAKVRRAADLAAREAAELERQRREAEEREQAERRGQLLTELGGRHGRLYALEGDNPDLVILLAEQTDSIAFNKVLTEKDCAAIRDFVEKLPTDPKQVCYVGSDHYRKGFRSGMRSVVARVVGGMGTSDA